MTKKSAISSNDEMSAVYIKGPKCQRYRVLPEMSAVSSND